MTDNSHQTQVQFNESYLYQMKKEKVRTFQKYNK